MFIHQQGRVTANKNEKQRVIMELSQGQQYKLATSGTSVTQTTDEFRSMSQARRDCLYPGERGLRYLSSEPYSFSSCVLECSWDWILEACGCVPFYLATYFPQQPLCEVFGGLCFRFVHKSFRSLPYN